MPTQGHVDLTGMNTTGVHRANTLGAPPDHLNMTNAAGVEPWLMPIDDGEPDLTTTSPCVDRTAKM